MTDGRDFVQYEPTSENGRDVTGYVATVPRWPGRSGKGATPEEAREALSMLTAPLYRAMDEPIMRWFSFTHLPPHLQDASRPFSALADHIMTLPRSAERTVALRKLLESKDAAVRAAMPEQ